MAPTEIDPLRIPDQYDWDFPPEIINPRLLKFAGEVTISRALEVIRLPRSMTISQLKCWLTREDLQPANAAELIAFALRATEARHTPLPVIAPASSYLLTEQSDRFEMFPAMITLLGCVDWVVGTVTRTTHFDKKMQTIIKPVKHHRLFSTNYHVLVRV
ncbi:hypothetical protein KBC99_03035 [Candidatus Saccharibacteria bacterium]|nr:hypothetical protein [Candidatus Saccharibacteria bacterium]